MTDAAAPSPTSRKKSFVIGGVIALVVIALIAGGLFYAASSADSRASDYQDDFAAWKDKDQPILLAATAEVPDGTYLRKGDTGTRKALAKQEKGCDAVTAARKKIDDAAGRLPTIEATGLLAKISSDYSDAGDASAARDKVVRTYAKESSAALAQIERDCRFNIALNKAATKNDKVYAKSSTYLMKNGDEAGVTCSVDACISSITSKKNTYADLRTKSTKIYRSTTLKLYQSKDCEETSYGAACRVIAKAYDVSSRQQLANYAFIRKAKTTVDNAGIDKGNAKTAKIDKRNAPRIKKAVLALDPALKKNRQVRKFPGWTDNLFSTADKLLLQKLRAQRAALEKL